QLFDGLVVDEAARILHLCSSETTRTLVRTTLPYFTAYFKSDFPNEFPPEKCDGDAKCKRGFTIRYRTIELDKDCGGTLLPDVDGNFFGVIQSPNYGFNYFPNLDCLWILDASTTSNREDDGRVIKAEIIDMDIPSSPPKGIKDLPSYRHLYSQHLTISPLHKLLRLIGPCRYDYITFKDGGDVTKPILGRYCNSRRPEGPVVSSGPKMVIQFHSNQTVNGKGFKIRYSSTCEKHFTQMNGTIQSLNYPNGVAYPFKCTYVIDAERTKAIRLRFNFIGLKLDIRSCFYDVADQEIRDDYVEFSGGHDSHDQINKRYFCARYPFIAPDGEMVTSASRPLTIRYSSSNIDNKGILFQYEQFDVGCGGIFNDEAGTITSPNYPEKYFAHMYCIYVINVATDKRVRLTFDVFELEVVPNREDCAYDSVEVYDVYINDNEHSEMHGRFCGTFMPPSILSTGSQLTVVFKSDRSVNGAGFSARWQAVDAQTDCHRTFTATSGEIAINIEAAQRVTQCDYLIALPSTNRILLKFENISSPCNEATLTIKNGVNEQSPGFGGLFRDSEICDDHPVNELRSQGNRIFMRLRTTSPRAIQFFIYYEQINSGCGGRIGGLSGALSSPQYPLKDSRTLNCDWHISVAAGNRVRFTITMMDDLNSADSSGFCSSFAPNYIDVADGPTATARVLRRYCKREVSLPPVDSETNELTIRYRQHGGSHFGSLYGFLAHYVTVCNDVVLTAHHGVLQSPGYPSRTLENRFCKWRIETTSANRIRLTFHRFRITELFTSYTPLCFVNYFEIGEKQIHAASVMVGSQHNDSTAIRRFCDRSGVPITILSENNFIDITFASRNEPENHFWLSWSTVGCGGIFTSESEIEVNISKLIVDAKIYECTWTITAPIGLRVLFSIEKFSIFADPQGCSYENPDFVNELSFYSGTSNRSGIASKVICESIETTTDYKSHTNELFVKLKLARKLAKPDSTDRILSGKIRFVQPTKGDDCGAVISVGLSQSISIHSPNYPNPYPKSIECIWLINAPAGHTVQFNLTHYKTLSYHPQRQEQRPWRANYYSNITCQSPISFVEGSLSFYNSNNTEGEVLERICNNLKEPKVIRSTSNQAVVSFQGAPYDRSYLSGDDETLHSIGFVLNISARCGGTLFADSKMQSLRLDSFDEDECVFYIRSEDAQRIYLRMDHLGFSEKKIHLPRGKNPAIIYVYDGSRDGAAVLGVFHAECSPSNKERVTRICSNQEFRSSGDTLRLHLRGLLSDQLHFIYFTYSTQIEWCGGVLHPIEGTVFFPFTEKSVECEWSISNTEGNKVDIELIDLKLPESEYCAQSYLEVRERNASGSIISRACRLEDFQTTISGEAFWIKLRYDPAENGDQSVEPLKPELNFKFTKVFGGLVSGQMISSPSADDWLSINCRPVEWNIIGKEEHWLLISILNMEIPDERGDNDDAEQRESIKGLTFNEGFCHRNQLTDECGPVVVVQAGYNPPKDFIIKSHMATIHFNAPAGSSFSLRWQEIPIAKANATLHAPNKTVTDDTAIFTCGGTLIPTYESQYLTNPGGMSPDGSFTTVKPVSTTSDRWNRYPQYRRQFRAGGYADNLKCRWIIMRPQFAGVSVRIVSMDLEEHIDCRFDYFALVAGDTGVITFENGQVNYAATKFCKHSDVGREESFRSEDMIVMYFITDRNRAGRGFVIEYKLICQSFQYLPSSSGILDTVIYSPNYPNTYSTNLSCSWVIMLESNRPIYATFIDVDIEKSINCAKDYVVVQANPIYVASDEIEEKICGEKINWNSTFPNGRVFITFNTDMQINRKGFALHLIEQLHDCSSDRLTINEGDRPKVLSSPNFPHMSPNSLDCEWVISAPSGHRIKFTVDANTFDLQDSSFDERCVDDYLEIRDGPSKHSPLIGVYCRMEPPSTIFSTWSYLYIRYQTDSFAQSMGWNATYEIASCGGSVVIPVNGSGSIRSP
uniref:CUB domain-containing protein n=1 Tax=Parascaris univalens TaxID=6257 RepID=A0A914ZLL6_PARUN